MRRASEKEGRRLQKLEWNDFKDVTSEAIQKSIMINGSLNKSYPDKVFQNNHYIVQAFHKIWRKGQFYDKIMIRRSDSKPIEKFSTLQRIKNEIFGEEIEAIQFFPKESELIDEANLYWLWVEIKI